MKFAILFASAIAKVFTLEYFVKWSIAIIIYLFLHEVLVKGPTISIPY